VVAPHLVVALSSHGFGHIGQTAPIIDALRARVPSLRVTLRTSAPPFKLVERFGDVSIQTAETDIGMVQQDAQLIDKEASAQAYLKFHRNWDERVEAEARTLRDLGTDAILANVPYLVLEAARRAGIPTMALCSLNWMDIYAYYFSERPEANQILEQMRHAYGSTYAFLQPAPSMPMPQLRNRRPIGPICQRGTSRRAWLNERLGLRPDERLMMVSLGGMDLRPPVEHWPALLGVRLLVPASWKATHPNAVPFEPLGIPYVDALWSCDGLICKPGYGSFVEAACVGIPVLYLQRSDWPETPYLVNWLKSVASCAPLSQEGWLQGKFLEPLERLWNTTAPSPLEPSGIEEAASALAQILV
jgi:hypothetical protein